MTLNLSFDPTCCKCGRPESMHSGDGWNCPDDAPDYCPQCRGDNRGAPHSPKCPNR